MTELQSKSPAFRQALRQSERLRIYILLGTFAAYLVLRATRTLVAPTPENLKTLLFYGLLAFVVSCLEFATLLQLKHAIREQPSLGGAFWYLNILLEFSIPFISIAILASPAMRSEYRPLTNPAFLLYFLLLTLSTLRLNPRLSVLCGIFASCSYLAAALHTGWRPPYANLDLSLYAPQKSVVSYAFSLILGGIVAAIVAREFRTQVEAALREAETRREMEHLRHDIDVARSIQQSLLPHSLPQVDGWQIAAWNQPADQTGGDYYDWQPLSNGRFLVALADVTGHGIGPALLASRLRANELPQPG